MSYQRPSFWQWRSNSSACKKKVGFGSPVENTLQRGDIISKVANYDSRDIRHQDAQTLFKNAGTNIQVVVQRDSTPHHPTGSTASSQNYSPLSASPHLSPNPPQFSPAGGVLTPYYNLPFTPLDNNYFEVVDYVSGAHRPQGQDMHVTKQPYRTTPLVLPGAKVKPEGGPTESYLRHHPNPTVRAPPHHLDNEFLLKQKVANSVLERLSTGDPNIQLVHKQFNSPINLYSESNITDTIKKQTGITPIKKNVTFNPAESEALKALQEEELIGEFQPEKLHEWNPPQSKVYAPNKTPPAKKAAHVVNQNPTNPYTGQLNEHEVIHQSGSFKRLMLSVLPESSF